MEAILAITSWISEFMKHSTSSLAALVVHCVTDKPGFAVLFLGYFVLMTIALVRQQNENSTD